MASSLDLRLPICKMERPDWMPHTAQVPCLGVPETRPPSGGSASAATPGQRPLPLDTGHATLGSGSGKAAALLAAPRPSSSEQAAGPAWPGSRGAERVKVCARPLRAGEQPGGKCEFLPVCLTAIKAAALQSRHWAARCPGNPRSWVLFEVEEGGSRRKGSAEPAALRTPAAPAHAPGAACPRPPSPSPPEDNLLTRDR